MSLIGIEKITEGFKGIGNDSVGLRPVSLQGGFEAKCLCACSYFS